MHDFLRAAAFSLSTFLFMFITGCSGSGGHAARVEHAHIVGFRSFWVTDPTRTYRTAFDDGQTYGATKSPRPVLVNLWYPARSDGPRMAHAEYLDIATTEPVIRPLAQKLADYEQAVINGEWMNGEPATASPAVLAEVRRALARPTPSVRSAPPADGRYPVVVYHGGAGSSFEDNALLCERLAAEGFVVIGSAFHLADGSSFNNDVLNAGREIEFLLRVAAEMSNTDLNRVGAVGHSAGAQGLLMYAAQQGTALDAVVSLDTTQDYRTMKDPRWPLLVAALEKGRAAYVTPTMFVAGPTAVFALADTLVHCERVYLTIPGLSHNEYISQGEVAAGVLARAQPDASGASAAHAREVEATGERLRSLVVTYLNAKLHDDDLAWKGLASLRTAKLEAEPRVEIVEKGAYAVTESERPTPRSVFAAFSRHSADGAIAELSRAERLDPRLFDKGFAFQLLFDLAVSAPDAEVLRLFEYFLSRGIDVRPFLVPQANLFASIGGYPKFVEGCVRMGRIVAGDDRSTREMVEQHGPATPPVP